MKWLKYLILLGILFSIGIVQAIDFDLDNCKIANCTETKLDTGEWIYDCTYYNCTKYPHKMTEETPNITITNCSADDFIDYLENYTSIVEHTLNLSEKMTDIRMTRDGYLMNWDVCEEDLEDLNISMNDLSHELQLVKDNSVDKDIFEAQKQIWEQNITTANNAVAEQEFYGWLKLMVGAVGASFIIWIFVLRKPEIRVTEVEKATGERGYDTRALDMDTKIAREVEKRLAEKMPKKKVD